MTESCRVHNSEFEERLTSPAPKTPARVDVSVKFRHHLAEPWRKSPKKHPFLFQEKFTYAKSEKQRVFFSGLPSSLRGYDGVILRACNIIRDFAESKSELFAILTTNLQIVRKHRSCYAQREWFQPISVTEFRSEYYSILFQKCCLYLFKFK